MPSDVLPSEAEQLRSWTLSQRVRDLSVVGVSVMAEEDANGETAIFLDVTLPNPSPGSGTWPIEDVLALHEAIDDKARQLQLSLPWHVRLWPTDEIEPEPEDID